MKIIISILFYCILLFSCSKNPIGIKIKQIKDNEITYSIKNSSKSTIKITLPKTKYLCWKYNSKQKIIENNKLIPNIYDSKGNKIIELNVYVDFHMEKEQEQEYKERNSSKLIFIKPNTTYIDTVFLPFSKNDCDLYYELKKNEFYCIQLGLNSTTKDSSIILSNKIKIKK